MHGVEAFFKASFFAQELEEDAAHSSRYDGDRGVSLLAAGAVLPVESAEVRRATDRHPTRLDQSPPQPFVAEGQEPTMMDLAAGAVRRRHHSGIATELIGANKALDLIDLTSNYRGQGG